MKTIAQVKIAKLGGNPIVAAMGIPTPGDFMLAIIASALLGIYANEANCVAVKVRK